MMPRREPIPPSPTSTLSWHHTQESASAAKQNVPNSFQVQRHVFMRTHIRTGLVSLREPVDVEFLTQKACAACKHIITERKLQFGAWFKSQKVRSEFERKNIACCRCRILQSFIFLNPVAGDFICGYGAEREVRYNCLLHLQVLSERRTSKVQNRPAR